MPIVQMPDGKMVELPDNPTPEQLDFLRKTVNPSPIAETGRVLDKTVRGGLAATPGIMGDMALGGLKNLHQGFDALPGKIAPGAAMPGVTLLQLLSELGKTKPIQATNFGDVTHKIETLGGLLPDKSKPQSEMGKAVANTVEPAVAAVTGGGVGTAGQKAMVGLAGGAGGEVSARLFGDNFLTRFLGSLVGGGAVGVAQNVKGNAENIARSATENVTDADWRRARVMQATLEKEGIPYLNSQLLGPRSTLDDTVAIAATNPAAGPRLRSHVENTADKSRQAYDRFSLQNLPPNVSERSQVLHDVQGAAEKSIESKFGAARQAYQGKMPNHGEEYSPEYVKGLYDDLITLAKSEKYGETSAAGKAIMKVADDLMLREAKDDFSQINPTMLLRAKKDGVDPKTLPGYSAETVSPLTNKHKINNLIKELNVKVYGKNGGQPDENYRNLPFEEVTQVLKDATPEFDAAREAMRKIIEKRVNPAKQGLTGQLAGMGGGVRPDKATARDTALSMVFPQDRLQPQAIVTLAKDIGGDGVGQLLREHLARNMERATALKSTDAQKVQGPFRFVEAVAGTNAQRQNLEAALKVTAEANGVNPATVRNGFYKLMRAFESTKDLKLPESIDRAAMAQEAGKTLPGFIVAPNSRLGRYFWEKATASTYNKIADMVLSKDGLAQLEAIAKSPKPETARQAAITIMSSTMNSDVKE